MRILTNMLKLLPLGFFSSIVLFILSTPPDALNSNFSKWAKWAGAIHLPHWIVERSVDNWVAISAVAMSVVYSLVVWRVAAARIAHAIDARVFRVRHKTLGAQFNANASLSMEVRRAEAQPDVWLQDGFLFAVHGRWLGDTERAFTSEDQMMRAGLVLQSLREFAGDGTLSIWGKSDPNRLAERIPKEFWIDHQIDGLRILGDDAPNVKTEQATHGASYVTYTALRTNRTEIERLFWSAPTNERQNRITVHAFLELARDKYGWDFSGKSMDPLDLEIGMLQAGVDGSITYWGRRAPSNTPYSVLDKYPLIKISPEHFASYQLVTFSANLTLASGASTFDNRQTKTSKHVHESEAYIDLHVNRIEAVDWLEHEAPQYRGKTDSAH